jgi:hypothetical protein
MACLSSPILWHKLSHSCPLKLTAFIHYYYFQFAPCNGAITQGNTVNEFSLFFVFVRVIMTGYGVVKRKPDDGSWIKEPDLFALRV